MTLDQYRSHVKVYFDPLVAIAIRCRLTPNFFTIAALFASAAAGILFYLRLELWGILAVALNAFCDAMDGAVAREMNIQSKRGDFLDHAVDRYADIFIICGLFAGGLVPWQIGVFALTGVLMSSYLGTQAQAVGVGRYYGGLLGQGGPARPDHGSRDHRPGRPHESGTGLPGLAGCSSSLGSSGTSPRSSGLRMCGQRWSDC